MNPAVFLDRDGVLVPDADGKDCELVPLPGVIDALIRLDRAGFSLHVVTNQPAVARGWTTMERLKEQHYAFAAKVSSAKGPMIHAWHVCPHHPHADLIEWRVQCDCRKPQPGLLLRAAAEHQIDLAESFMVGDRLSDVAAGIRAGCRTIQVLSGRHHDAPIISSAPPRADEQPDYCCANLMEAAVWICAQ